jgi:hypothetical protein
VHWEIFLKMERCSDFLKKISTGKILISDPSQAPDLDSDPDQDQDPNKIRILKVDPDLE